jgi:chromosome segregation ATPase
LKIDIGRFQNENADLKQRLNKLANLEKQIMELIQVKSTLSEQVTSLTIELKDARDEGSSTKTEVEGLLKKLETVTKEVNNLELENKDLLTKQAESTKSIHAVQILKNENIKLRTVIDELKAARSTSPDVGGSPASVNEEAIRAHEEKIVSLETALQEWTDLAKVSQKYHEVH